MSQLGVSSKSREEDQDLSNAISRQRLLVGGPKAFCRGVLGHVILGIVFCQDEFAPEVCAKCIFFVFDLESRGSLHQLFHHLQKQDLPQGAGNSSLLLLQMPFL